MTKRHRRIRVLVIDDHPAVRLGLSMLLPAEGIEICGEAAGSQDALAKLGEVEPDVALLDLSLDGESGLSLIAPLCERGVVSLVYSMHNDAQRVSAALAAGALGYVTKREMSSVLGNAIRSAASGQLFLSPEAAKALAGVVLEGMKDGAPRVSLSRKEREVYRLLGEGLTAGEIAHALGITVHTVATHFARMQNKLHCHGMHELRRHAIQAFRDADEL